MTLSPNDPAPDFDLPADGGGSGGGGGEGGVRGGTAFG